MTFVIMYIKLVIFYSVVIYSQGVLCGVNVDSIINAQNGQHGQYFIANYNSHNIRNPLHLTSNSKAMPQVPVFQNHQRNVIDSARNQHPLNQNLMNQFMTYNQNNFVPNKQFIGNNYRESFPQNLRQSGLELNREVLKKIYEPKHTLHNTDIRNNNVNKKEITFLSNNPSPVAIHKNMQPEILPVIKQNNIVTNFGGEIKNNLHRINNQEGIKNQETDSPSRRTLNENNNKIQPTKNRYIFVRKNGSIEQYDNLEVILKKYPHLNLTNNLHRYFPNSVKTKHDISLPHQNIKLTVNSTVIYAKINETEIQHTKEQTKTAPLQKTFKVNNVTNSAQSINLTDIEKKLANHQMSTHQPLQTVVEQDINVKRPVVERNQNNTKINSTLHESISTEIPNMEPLTVHVPENKKLNSVNLETFKTNSNFTDEDETKANQTDKVKVTPAELINFNNLGNISQDKLNNKENKTVNEDNLNGRTEKATLVEGRNDLNNSQVTVDKLDHDSSNVSVNENLTNSSMQIPVTEKIPNKDEKSKSNKEEKTESKMANDDQFQSKQTNTTKSDKDISKLDTQHVSLDHLTDDPKSEEDYEEDYSSLSKPVLWVRTTDPEFWSKLVDDNDDYSFVYIINVQSQPKIERERNKTIYPNGTVIEEITESVWENGDVKPKVKKTVKVTPNAVTG